MGSRCPQDEDHHRDARVRGALLACLSHWQRAAVDGGWHGHFGLDLLFHNSFKSAMESSVSQQLFCF